MVRPSSKWLLLPLLGLAGCSALLGIDDHDLAGEAGSGDDGAFDAGVGREAGPYSATGGIRSTAPSPSVDGGARLVAGAFELGARTCNALGTCVTGGLVP
jgi:hypothetical protein